MGMGQYHDNQYKHLLHVCFSLARFLVVSLLAMETTKFLKLDQQHLRSLAMTSVKSKINTLSYQLTRYSRNLMQEKIQKSQIQRLRAQLAVLERALSQSSPITQSNLAAYAQSECFHLTTSLIATLPREIRDMVYTHLFTNAQEQIDSSYFASILDPVKGYYTFDPSRWKATHYPQHFWDVTYVGDIFLHELAETYYRTTTFIFTDKDGLLSRFLNTDQLGLGFLPKSHVRNVEVKLNAINYDRGSFRAYMYGVPKTMERLRAGLEGIFELKDGARIGVCFETEAKDDKERRDWVDMAKNLLFEGERREEMGRYEIRFIIDEGRA